MEKNGNLGQSVSLPDNATLLKAKIRLGVTRLFKNYLFAFEEIIESHDEAIAKLKTSLPDQYKEFVELADYLSDAKIELMRKRVLGLGNDLIRDLDDQIDCLRIDK